MKKELILGSSSIYRKELLSRLRIDFNCLSPDLDEDLYKRKIPDPSKLAQTLAYEKAKSILEKKPEAIVIGSDQLGVLNDEVLGSPGNMENAINLLMRMSGKEHSLLTAVCILWDDQKIEFLDETKLKMREFSKEEAIEYLEIDKPFKCAGSYKIEGYGITLFEKIDTSDFTAIVGLPLMKLNEQLRKIL